MSKDLAEEYERLVNPEKALEDSKPPRIKEEPLSDISFPVSEEPEADPASGDQALPIGVLGAHGERLPAGLDGDPSPHASGGPHCSVHLMFGKRRLEWVIVAQYLMWAYCLGISAKIQLVIIHYFH